MNDAFAVAEHQVEDLLEAARRLRATLLRTETLSRRTLKSFGLRSTVTATIKANRSDAAGKELTDALKEFASAPSHSRLCHPGPTG